MSPEQAKGKRVNKRADIWSWGVMLYELLAGERLFKGGDAADTLAQVLTKEPPLERVPTQVRKLLRRCLEKDPKRRLRDIGEARYLLEEPVLPSFTVAARLDRCRYFCGYRARGHSHSLPRRPRVAAWAASLCSAAGKQLRHLFRPVPGLEAPGTGFEPRRQVADLPACPQFGRASTRRGKIFMRRRL
jgi:hypothetical protein